MPKRKYVDPGLDCSNDVDRTKQEFKDECDMNNIVARINKSGFVPLEAQDSLRRAVFGDASAMPTSLEQIYEVAGRADAAFEQLPAVLRERFGDMATALKWIEDPANLKEAQDLGLLAKSAPAVPAAPAIVAEEAAASAPQEKSGT